MVSVISNIKTKVPYSLHHSGQEAYSEFRHDITFPELFNVIQLLIDQRLNSTLLPSQNSDSLMSSNIKKQIFILSSSRISSIFDCICHHRTLLRRFSGKIFRKKKLLNLIVAIGFIQETIIWEI